MLAVHSSTSNSSRFTPQQEPTSEEPPISSSQTPLSGSALKSEVKSQVYLYILITRCPELYNIFSNIPLISLNGCKVLEPIFKPMYSMGTSTYTIVSKGSRPKNGLKWILLLKFSSDGLSKKITLIQGDLKLGLGMIYLLTVHCSQYFEEKKSLAMKFAQLTAITVSTVICLERLLKVPRYAKFSPKLT